MYYTIYIVKYVKIVTNINIKGICIMLKVNNLTQKRKIIYGGIGLLILGIIIALITILIKPTKEENETILNKDSFLGLSETEYEVLSFNEDKMEDKLEVNIKGDLLKEEVIDFTKNLDEKNKISGWNKNNVIVNIFSLDTTNSEAKGFYTNGLIYKIVLDSEKKKSNISEYVSIPNIDKTDVLEPSKKVNFNVNDGNIVIGLDMNISNFEKDLTSIMQQIKTFVILFKDMNKDKEIKSIEINLNPNNDKKKYNFNTNYENILEVVELMNL